MENKNNTVDEIDSGLGDLAPMLIAGAVIALAGYGLYKLFSKETEARRSIANLKESDFIEEMAGRDIL